MQVIKVAGFKNLMPKLNVAIMSQVAHYSSTQVAHYGRLAKVQQKHFSWLYQPLSEFLVMTSVLRG